MLAPHPSVLLSVVSFLTAPGVIYEPNIFLYYEPDTPLCVPVGYIYYMCHKLLGKSPLALRQTHIHNSSLSLYPQPSHKSLSSHNQADFHICLSLLSHSLLCSESLLVRLKRFGSTFIFLTFLQALSPFLSLPLSFSLSVCFCHATRGVWATLWSLITLLLAAEADKLIRAKLQLTTEYLGVLTLNLSSPLATLATNYWPKFLLD